MIALGLKRSNGLLRILPNFCIGSLPGRISRPPWTISVAPLATRVPSNVSRIASCRIQLRETNDMIVELSLRMSSTVVKTARGPLTKTMIASCGIYVKRNMLLTTPTDKVSVGTRRESSGFHKARWLAK